MDNILDKSDKLRKHNSKFDRLCKIYMNIHFCFRTTGPYGSLSLILIQGMVRVSNRDKRSHTEIRSVSKRFEPSRWVESDVKPSHTLTLGDGVREQSDI